MKSNYGIDSLQLLESVLMIIVVSAQRPLIGLLLPTSLKGLIQKLRGPLVLVLKRLLYINYLPLLYGAPSATKI